MNGRETLANTIRCLELLGESLTAWDKGDKGLCDALVDQAAAECGADTLMLIQGCMRFGEIPTPESDEWHPYLAHQRDRLAVLEREEGE